MYIQTPSQAKMTQQTRSSGIVVARRALQHYFAVAKYLFERPFHNMQSKTLAPEVHHRTAVQGSGRLHINHGTCTLITLDRLVASPHLRQWRVAVIAAILFGGAL